ncbi:hypothetical protein [Paracoccus sp. MC1862]|uniref:hypothetical protein n=1 Tax=Paracoccus sp. MC1862 TaxID=2760307 RepID=UPI00160315A8|nr:hypothetical protein [Paracoccus sp. MC1862]MBB1497608.1 hypothetical protein [Paracoccus sp. MC1862]QQO44056.1 hypothetical protein JGR78_11660 [Paracoccus sp. MC1862]
MSDTKTDLDRLLAETRRLNAEADRLMAEERKLMAERLLRRQRRGPWFNFVHEIAPFLGIGLVIGLVAALAVLLLPLMGTPNP